MTELAVYQPNGAALAIPDPHDMDSWIAVVQDVIKVANVIHDTPFVPDGLRGSAPAVAAAILAGREMGLGPMTSLANIDVIKGKPTQKALLMRAMILGQGHKWEEVDVSDTRVIVRGCRKGESKWSEVTFTAAQAKTAGIDLGRYPQDKLYARASVRLARRRFADVIVGMPYSPEDVEDGDDIEVGTVTEVAATNGHAPAAAPRTAQRKTRRHVDRGEQGINPPLPAAPAAAPDLPPLPGEDEADPTTSAAPAAGATGPKSSTAHGAETRSPDPDERDYDSPGTINPGQITAIWTIFTNVYQFTKDEKDQARAVCAHVIGHELDSTRDMSRNEARTVLDTLSNWRETAERNGVTAREFLLELLAMAAGEPGE